jgi:hypothetical protein
MSRDNEDFGSLRRLLALKRHEQPPPGYFEGFSVQVITRIKSGERVDESVLARLFWEAPWLQRLWGALEAKPIMAGAFGAAACGLLVFGVIYSERIDVKSTDNLAGLQTPTSDVIQLADFSPSEQPLPIQPAAIGLADRTASAQPIGAARSSATLFDLIPQPQARTASLGLTLTPQGN